MFNEFIMDQGIKFEEYIICMLRENNDIIQKAESFQAKIIKSIKKQLN